MEESRFLLICVIAFFCSFVVLSIFVLTRDVRDFAVNGYTSVVDCQSGACTFTGNIAGVSDMNETLFYKLEKPVVVDAVFFVGMQKPNFSVGDCVSVRGIAQEFHGKQSIVLQKLARCK